VRKIFFARACAASNSFCFILLFLRNILFGPRAMPASLRFFLFGPRFCRHRFVSSRFSTLPLCHPCCSQLVATLAVHGFVGLLQLLRISEEVGRPFLMRTGYDTYLSLCHSPCKSINISPMFGCNGSCYVINKILSIYVKDVEYIAVM
jgi:hypothetical protein